MALINVKNENGLLTIGLVGHIDSNNAPAVEQEITDAREANEYENVIVDCSELEYISSAGLRIILRLKKLYPELKVINVSSEVYEIFDITGFTEMMEVRKAYRQLSVEGCEIIGQGANGKVYRIDPDTVLKVYHDVNALDDIKRERELARTALILGIPTAIPYDVVKVGDVFGSVFELINAETFAKLIQNNHSSLDDVVRMSVDLLKTIHSTEVKPGSMPDMKTVVKNWAAFLSEYLEQEDYQKLHDLVDAVPDDLHMIHGDYHLKNIMLQNNEPLLIDMDTLCHGHPVFEFASIFNAYQGYSEMNHDNMMDFLGIPYEMGAEIWNKTLHFYFDDKTEEEIQDIADKAKLVGYTRIMRRTIRRNGFNTELGRREIENAKNHIHELVNRLDSLAF